VKKRVLMWSKRSLIGIIAILLCASFLPLPPNTVVASDLSGHWAEQIIGQLVEKGFISGYPDGTFKPDNPVTRAEFIKILSSVLGMVQKFGLDSQFSDVGQEDWFFGYVMGAVSNGIVSGYPDGTFKPNAQITREEASKIVVKAKGIDETQIPSEELNSILASLSDSNSISDWAKPFVAAAIKNELMKGDPSGAFRPLDPITRAEAATLGSRIIEVVFGGTFIFARGADSSSLDPAAIWDDEVGRVTCQIFETLVSLQGETTLVGPGLATDWWVSDDHLTWTFKLRQGVKFHDGTDFNADAVVFNFERWWDKDNPYHKGSVFEAFSYTFGGFKGEEGCVLTDIKKVDDFTVQFSFNQHFSPFLSILTEWPFEISSPTAIKSQGPENYGTNASNPPVGTGPFKFSDWVKDDKIILVRNPDYWGEKAKVDQLIFRVIPDNAARYLALKTGEIQGMEGANKEDAIAAKQESGLQVLLRPPLNVGTVMFNLEMPPFNDIRVRKAIAMAIDKESLVKAFIGDFGLVANQMLPPSVWGYNKDLKDYPYDPEAAKALLKEVAPDGLPPIDFWYMPNPRNYIPDPKGMAEAIAADLSKIGLTVNLKTEDWTSYLNDWTEGKLPMFLAGWTGDNGDPDNFLYFAFGMKGTEGGFYENPEVFKLINDARVETDIRKREKLYKQAALLIHEDCPRVFLCYVMAPILLSNKVQGYVVNPTPVVRYNTVWLKP
jgi:peptide/nickel transport system substrate-binding protein